MEPKFKSGDLLYYVNPFVFTIDKVLIQFIDEPNTTGFLYYVDHTGGYLAQEDLFLELEQAQEHALGLLNRFYSKKIDEIDNSDPILEIQEND